MGQRHLTPEERLVAHYYLADPKRDRRAAWLRVYATDEVQHKASAASAASYRLFHKPAFAAYLSAEIARLAETVHLDEEMVLREWGHIGLLDPAEAFDSDGNLLPITEMPKHVRKAIQSFETKEVGEGNIKVSNVKFVSKTAALDSIAKHFGLFREIKEVRVKWMDGASMSELERRREYIRNELIKRGVLADETVDESRRLSLEPPGAEDEIQ